MIPRTIVALACLASLSVTSAAFADDTRKQRAEPIFQEALRLHDANRDAEALAKYEEAYAIYPSPNVLFWIARCEELLGRKLDALRDYRHATTNGLFDPTYMERGRERIRDLESQVSRIDIIGPERMHATIDGVAVTAKETNVLPGHHTVAASLGDRATTRDVLAEAGSNARVDLTEDLAPHPASPKPDVARSLATPGSGAAPAKTEPRHGAGEYALVGGFAGLGAASFLASALFASASNSSRADAVAAGAASNHACDQPTSAGCAAVRSKNDDANRDRSLSIAAGVTSGVFLAGAAACGFVFFALPRGERARGSARAAWIAPAVDPRGAAVEAGVHF